MADSDFRGLNVKVSFRERVLRPVLDNEKKLRAPATATWESTFQVMSDAYWEKMERKGKRDAR